MTRRPWVNYALVAANVLIFLWSLNWRTKGVAYERIDPLLLHPATPAVYQFFTAMFLHGGWMHLIGNMIFLWVFGNAINDRLGHLGYLAFYLAGGICAGLGYIVLAGTAPVLGASGAISAVTGAYLVLFPRVRVTLLMFFVFITYFEISSLFFLLFQFLFNMYMSVTPMLPGIEGGGGVAYAAHAAGYVFGIVLAAVLLATRVLPRDVFDLLNLIRNWRRRGRYQRMVAQGWDPFAGRQAKARPGGVWVESHTVEEAPPPDSRSAREIQLRREIAEACEAHDTEAAISRYLELVQIAEDAVLPRQQQLDVANQLMATNRYPAAADAYERFLNHYGGYQHSGDIFLMLGILYGRYLHQDDRAEHYLQQAVDKLRNEQKLQLARADLDAVRARRYK